MEMKIELYTVGDAARFLQRSADSVRVLERTGKLRALKTVGGVRLFSRASLERFASQPRPQRGRRGAKETTSEPGN